jgi:hypothetical protein
MPPIAVEIDATTGKAVERPFTPEETAQRAADEAAAQAAADAAGAAEAEAAQARADAIAHAKSLGFTDAMIAVMYPGLSVQAA